MARQRQIKRLQSQQPLSQMTKTDVEEKRLAEYVVMPDGTETSFKTWWKTITPSQLVSVRLPHSRHGNAGKTSNSAKTTVMQDFLQFVDVNSQPNGRSDGSSGPTAYFLPKFDTVQTPKVGSINYEEHARRSVVSEFNKAQKDLGRGTCSNGSSHNWLKQHRSKVGICPHQEDYCDTCATNKEAIRAKQTTLNRMREASATDSETMKRLDDEIKVLQQSHERHRTEAAESHKHYISVTKKCADEWKAITTLESQSPSGTEDQRRQLSAKKHCFTLVLSTDYQMQKLVPYWGQSPQPGSTYYLQKLNHDILGIVNHSTGDSHVYLFDEKTGPKNTDHMVSYLSHYVTTLPAWVRRAVFLDNTCSTNKNWYSMAWAMEMIQQKKLDYIRVSFMIAGHTKFAPDLLFSKVAKTYTKSDVFTTDELSRIIGQYATVTEDDGEIVCDWRNSLDKYSTLPGIRSLHDFIYTINSVTNSVVAKVRPLCYTGSFTNATIHVKAGRSLVENVIPDDTENYSTLGKTRELTTTKMGHLKQMFRNFIPPDRCLPFVTV